jgi:hypothetical protein
MNAAVMLLPDVQTLERVAAIFLALEDQPKWSVSTTPLNETPLGEMLAVHLVREIPFGDTTCPSEALVLGPFDEFPPTRRAPFTALEIYVGEPRKMDPKDETKPTEKANLAHISMHLPTHDAFKHMWKQSEEGRAASLGGTDMRAKAKVSFVLPIVLAQQLGRA